MNDLTPQQIREQLLAGMPEAPEVSQWPTQIGQRIAVRRRRAAALRVTAAVAVLAVAAGVIWRAASVSTPATPEREVVVGAPGTTIAPSAAPATDVAPATNTTAPSSLDVTTAPQTDDPPSNPPSELPPPESVPPPGGLPRSDGTESACFLGDSPGDNPASLPAGAVSVTWCTPIASAFAAPLEQLEGPHVAKILARYNALPKASASGCTPAAGTTYWLEVVYPDGGVLRLDGDLGSCNKVGLKGGSRTLSSALGAAFDAQRGGGLPEVDPVPDCGPDSWNGAVSLMAFQPSLFTRGFRCDRTEPVAMPANLMRALATGMTTVPADLVPTGQKAWVVVYTASGDPVPMWIVDGWVWGLHYTVSGDPSSAEYLGWQPTPAQLALLVGS